VIFQSVGTLNPSIGPEELQKFAQAALLGSPGPLGSGLLDGGVIIAKTSDEANHLAVSKACPEP
jgi:hypothetical protein